MRKNVFSVIIKTAVLIMCLGVLSFNVLGKVSELEVNASEYTDRVQQINDEYNRINIGICINNGKQPDIGLKLCSL